jgi:rhodanese-related sulfurtransferase
MAAPSCSTCANRTNGRPVTPPGHIPLGQLSRRAAELPEHRAVVTVCRSGARSARAAAMLARDGREVSNLAGGMRAWVRAGLPVIARGGVSGHVA